MRRNPEATTLTVGNPYVNVNYNLEIVPAAPGIFMTNGFTAAPFSSAAAGHTTTLFITGDGQVSPSLADGTSLPFGNSNVAAPQTQASRDGDGGGPARYHRISSASRWAWWE